MAERATFDDLIARKLSREKARGEIKEITVPSMGKALAFERPADSVAITFLDQISDGEEMSDLYEAYKNIIYRCCPALQSEKLRTDLEVVVPTDVVPMLMEIDDVLDVGTRLMIFLGLAKPKGGEGQDGNETVEDKVKN